MFKNQPRGLYTLALANTGERFGYYTMIAIFVLFLQAKFGFSESYTSTIYGIFLGVVYFMPLIGGLLADKMGYGKMVTFGFIVMFAGYLLLTFPIKAGMVSLVFMFGALLLISVGTGFFKGNLQVMVGNLYDDPKYSSKRDTAFSIFYMAINIGAFFAPTAATKVVDYFMAKGGFTYNSAIPALAHQFIDNKITAQGMETLTALKGGQNYAGDMLSFCNTYIEKLSDAYSYSFGVACVSLIVSMAIYFFFRGTYKGADYYSNHRCIPKDGKEEQLTPEQTKKRITALLLVFAVVIFFWMSFHQNGLTMTFFARDYTAHSVTGLNRMWFNVINLACVIVAVYALISFFQSKTSKAKIISSLVVALSAAVLIYEYNSTEAIVNITPQIFQQFNPFFVVVLTPLSLGIFSLLAKRGKEPTAPRKIGYGMIIAAFAFLILAVGSMGLITPDQLKETGISNRLVSPDWLISTYLVLTFAELLLSPMGISFVSRVAPPKYKGAMMGCWFASTAVGNYLVSVVGYLWGGLPLWAVWGVLIGCCLISAAIIFSIMKRIEAATK